MFADKHGSCCMETAWLLRTVYSVLQPLFVVHVRSECVRAHER